MGLKRLLQPSKDGGSRLSRASPQEYPERAARVDNRLDASNVSANRSPTTTTNASVSTSTRSCLRYRISKESSSVDRDLQNMSGPGRLLAVYTEEQGALCR